MKNSAQNLLVMLVESSIFDAESRYPYLTHSSGISSNSSSTAVRATCEQVIVLEYEIMELFTAVLQDSNKPEAHVTSCKVYVTGLKEEVDESDLIKYFTEFGEIESVDLITDHQTRRSRGFAFVSFRDYDPVDKIVCKF